MSQDLIPNFIEGEWTKATATETLAVKDPASGVLLGTVPMSAKGDVDRAVQAAAKAFPAWRMTSPVERARVLFRLHSLMEKNHEDLARSLTTEHGKVLAEARGEVQRGIDSIEHACAIPTLMMGDTLEDVSAGVDCETIRQPLGVFAAVTPYNFPVMIPMWFWPFAIATGNTFVLKPSEQNPLTHQRILELAREAGLPKGVLNVVHGGRETVDALLEHPKVVGVSFVGSSRVAFEIYRKGSANGKRVQALGGAKNHIFVLPDADPDKTAQAVLASVFGSTGQRCLAGSVVVGVGDAYQGMRDRLLDGASSIRLGHGLDDTTDMGPVISGTHRDRVKKYIDIGVKEAKLVLDGRNASVAKHPEGNWVGPTVFEDVSPEMEIGREEIFGPVMGLTRAPDLDSAIALLDRVAYGNASSLFTSSGQAAREFRYRAGISMLGINIGVAAPMAMFPFGGSRGSFYGDLKAQGKDAIDFYTDKRVVISRWVGSSPADPHHQKNKR
jgi:malonate-semialdehyde dehydrogenase (acetylating)/methylmalonate-semialdehyde dehydrogenase